ncbi:hypothetical protein BDZ88DRAFT_12340 [Geranomyces variabilis]|nr:hypothetical protein BDZ88DRAFT_12340 [Geranomyces variabilis]KAJ3143076.1 hypothetical protein HDU90_002950 [Geranomyces variabilis]
MHRRRAEPQRYAGSSSRQAVNDMPPDGDADGDTYDGSRQTRPPEPSFAPPFRGYDPMRFTGQNTSGEVHSQPSYPASFFVTHAPHPAQPLVPPPQSVAPAKPKRKRKRGNGQHFCEHPGCFKQFSRQDHLVRHEKNHSQSTVYPCTQCDRTFVRSDLLLRHQQRHLAKEQQAVKAEPAYAPGPSGYNAHVSSAAPPIAPFAEGTSSSSRHYRFPENLPSPSQQPPVNRPTEAVPMIPGGRPHPRHAWTLPNPNREPPPFRSDIAYQDFPRPLLRGSAPDIYQPNARDRAAPFSFSVTVGGPSASAFVEQPMAASNPSMHLASQFALHPPLHPTVLHPVVHSSSNRALYPARDLPPDLTHSPVREFAYPPAYPNTGRPSPAGGTGGSWLYEDSSKPPQN